MARDRNQLRGSITAKAKDPQLAAQIANAVASSIVERASGEGNAAMRSGLRCCAKSGIEFRMS